MSRKPAPMRVAEPLFHPFDTNVPDAATCLDDVYDAFADIPVQYGWCRQCFDLDAEQRMRAARNVRQAPLEVFSPIYFENPNCSGGPDTFLHWLPRGLELVFFDRYHDPDLAEQMMRIGWWHRPGHEQAAVRALLNRVARNWFGEGHVAPLRLVDPAWLDTRRGRLNISRRIVEALLYVRVAPAALFGWLIGLDRADAWDCLLDLVRDDSLLAGPAYYVLDDASHKPLLEAGLEALERIARHTLHAMLPADRLAEIWLALQEADPALAERVADAEALEATTAPCLSDDAIVAEEARLRAALDAAPGRSAPR